MLEVTCARLNPPREVTMNTDEHVVGIFKNYFGRAGSLLRCGLSLAVASRTTLCCAVRAAHSGGISGCGAQALGRKGFCSRSPQPQQLWLPGLGALGHTCDSPDQGLNPRTPAFLSLSPPGKSCRDVFQMTTSFACMRFKT